MPSAKPRSSSQSNLSMMIVSILAPISLISVILWPILLILSLIPVIGLVAIPLLLALTIFLLYSLAWLPFLLLAQEDLPENESIKVLLPLSPLKAQKVVVKLIETMYSLSRSNWIELMLDYSYRKIIVLRYRPNNTQMMIKPDIIYNYSNKRRLDVYLPIKNNQNNNSNSDDDDIDQILHPVLVFIHPGNWRWTDKSNYLQLGLRFRRFGYCVVIPDFTQFPNGRCGQAVSDIKAVLNWVASSISEYGGDSDRVFLLGHGSGAHLSMLTVVESSIQSSKLGNPNQIKIITNNNVIESDNENESVKIEGLILISGIYDPIKILREQVKSNWNEISCLRRFLGPTHTSTRSHSPAHLIHNSLNYLNVSYLPSKILIIHGGQDDQVPIFQSQILNSLLVKLFDYQERRRSLKILDNDRRIPELKFKAYKNLNHFDSLICLMMESNQNHLRRNRNQNNSNNTSNDGSISDENVGNSDKKDKKSYSDSIISEILSLL